MIITKQNLSNARYEVPDEISGAVQRTLTHLPERNGEKQSPRRLAALLACAAVLALAVIVVSTPTTRAYAEGLLRSIFKLYAGQPDSGFSPGQTADGNIVAVAGSAQSSPQPGAVYEQVRQNKFDVVADSAVPLNVSQTSGGVKATVLEAAILDDNLFVGLAFDGVPANCFPAEESYHITLNGRRLHGGSLRQATTIGGVEAFSLETPLEMAQEDLPGRIEVKLAFSLRQFPDGGLGDGEKFASFEISFEMDKPSVFGTLPPADDTIIKDPMMTEMPASLDDGLDPFAVDFLSEPAGVSTWAQFTHVATGVTFDYPNDWVEDDAVAKLPELAGTATRLSALSGVGGCVQIYAVKTGDESLREAEDYVLRLDVGDSGYVGTEFKVHGGLAFFYWDNSGRSDASAVLLMLPRSLRLDGRTYDSLLIWAPKDYNTRILRTLTLQ